MPGDDLTQRLAEVIAIARFGQERWAVMSEATRITQIQWHGVPAARAVLASGLVVPRADYDDKLDLIRKLSDEFIRNDTVPTSGVLALAEEIEDAALGHIDDYVQGERAIVKRLRALTQQETP